MVRAGLLVGGSCGMMLTLSPQLCAISVCSFPVAAGLSRWMGDKLRERRKGVQDALADAAAEAERAIGGVRTVKSSPPRRRCARATAAASRRRARRRRTSA